MGRWCWRVVLLLVLQAWFMGVEEGAGAVGPLVPDSSPHTSSGAFLAESSLLQELRMLTELVLQIRQRQDNYFAASPPSPPPPPVVQDCSTLRQAGIQASGVYQLSPFVFPGYCDMDTDGGGWTLIQRRRPQTSQENFSRDWRSYRRGFGQVEGEMWIGLQPLHQLTHSGRYELRVDMVDYEKGPRYAHYQEFAVGPESDGYRLRVGGYSGNAGDALSLYHSGRRFSTYDRDQDVSRNKSCAREKEGGWWFHACYAAHPNGRYPFLPQRKGNSTEIRWWSTREDVLVLTHIEMKIRRRTVNATDAVEGDGDATDAGSGSETGDAWAEQEDDILHAGKDSNNDTGEGNHDSKNEKDDEYDTGSVQVEEEGESEGEDDDMNSGKDNNDEDYQRIGSSDRKTGGDAWTEEDEGDLQEEYLFLEDDLEYNISEHEGRADIYPWNTYIKQYP